MFYQRSYEIERRLEAVLRMIREGRFSTPKIAKEIGVSIPTISRDVTALRQRGHDIRSKRNEQGWQYVLANQRPTRQACRQSKRRKAHVLTQERYR